MREVSPRGPELVARCSRCSGLSSRLLGTREDWLTAPPTLWNDLGPLPWLRFRWTPSAAAPLTQAMRTRLSVAASFAPRAVQLGRASRLCWIPDLCVCPTAPRRCPVSGSPSLHGAVRSYVSTPGHRRPELPLTPVNNAGLNVCPPAGGDYAPTEYAPLGACAGIRLTPGCA